MFRFPHLLIAVFATLPLFHADAELSFERDIRPIVKTHCFHCHGEGEKLKGGVDLRLRRFMLRELKDGGGNVMVPGKPDASEMLRLVREGGMPKEGRKLNAGEIAKLEKWIAAGAPTLREEPAEVPKFFITEEEREFWAFQPVARPAVPGEGNPIDAFVSAKLKEHGLDFAPEADARTLIRRIALDLTGLPPTPGEVEAFAAESIRNPQSAIRNLADRLLASPAYGERWARHWLDVAGYADTNGMTEADSPRPHAWRYRDYVIRAFAADKPWNDFIVEQLAGDELAGATHANAAQIAANFAKLDMLTATGFLRMAPDGTGDEVADAKLARNEVIADTLKVVSSSLLGLTVGCAQCHDHRYDPIAQTDYFKLRAIFEPALDWKNWRNPKERLTSLYTPEQRLHAEAIEGEAREWDLAADARTIEHKNRIFAARLAALPEEMREPIRLARATPPDKRTPEQRQLFKDQPGLNVDAGSLDLFDKEADNAVKAMRAEGNKLRATKPVEPFVMALTEVAGQVPETHLFNRGDHDQPREKIAPGELTILGVADIPERGGETTQRRLAYARWLTSGRHPLVARVLVNRFWLGHFGRGLVNTPGDFGTLGERPTHPELLDWLASEFMANGWKLKPLHKLLVTSRAYRQSSRNDAAQAADPDNRFYARFRLRRLDAETLRDSMLVATGKLNAQQFGPAVGVALDPAGRIVPGNQKKDANGDPIGFDPVGDQEFRRSIYITMRRRQPLTMLDTFDAPVMSPNCSARVVTTVAPQSLLLMNDAFIVNTATQLAERLRREHAGDARGQLTGAWRLLYGSAPSDAELRTALSFLAEQSETLRARAAQAPPKKDAPPADPQLQALASLCQTLLSANRFLYVE